MMLNTIYEFLVKNNDVVRPPQRWCQLLNICIADPDGWRNPGDDYDKPITLKEFIDKAGVSTLFC